VSSFTFLLLPTFESNTSELPLKNSVLHLQKSQYFFKAFCASSSTLSLNSILEQYIIFNFEMITCLYILNKENANKNFYFYLLLFLCVVGSAQNVVSGQITVSGGTPLAGSHIHIGKKMNLGCF
jgi:hypothetical protein